MSIRKTIGGDRLGSGKKMKVSLHNYERSTHDLGYIWRSSMAPGTLVPFMSMVGLPGDTFDIDLDTDVKTLPTLGPLFGSFKLQLDVFSCPIRLYNGVLHNNKLGIGMDMSKVKLPLIAIDTKNLDLESSTPLEFQQINQSCLLAYLGIRGVGRHSSGSEYKVSRSFNAIPLLAYWDIYKNYYANKQEEIGAVIHGDQLDELNWEKLEVYSDLGILENVYNKITLPQPFTFEENKVYFIWFPKNSTGVNGSNIELYEVGTAEWLPISALWSDYQVDDKGAGSEPQNYDILNLVQLSSGYFECEGIRLKDSLSADTVPQVHTFQLSKIDEMREDILSETKEITPYVIAHDSLEPYSLPLKEMSNGYNSSQLPMEGLALKTYQSNMYNNWLSTEWIDGENGINAITAISTAGDSFTLDTLNLSKKVYDMLNRIAVSGGSYNDWVEAVYGTEPWGTVESPVYVGGLSKEVVFSEVIATADNETNPLGTLAGKGVMAKKHKGGNVVVKVNNEPCYIIGIVSLTPRIDYSQGNEWDVHLKTMDDFHKPALDEIGFQELITEQMAFWDSLYNPATDTTQSFSAGKQPAWLNYMTNVNKCYGNFADPRKEMFMTLNRRYEADETGRIKDLTTYIDPVKFNYMFAQTSRDAQNFWTQISVDITARRKMSAKVMPNL